MKKHDEEIVKTTLRLPRALLRRMKISAAKNDVSMQDLIIRIFDAHCTREESKP
jgi:hypothetical protein